MSLHYCYLTNALLLRITASIEGSVFKSVGSKHIAAVCNF